MFRQVFAKTFKWIYTVIYRCTEERERRARLAKMEIDVEALGAEAFQEQQIQVGADTSRPGGLQPPARQLPAVGGQAICQYVQLQICSYSYKLYGYTCNLDVS